MKTEKKAELKGAFKGIGIVVVLMMVMVGGAMGITHITDSTITIDGVSVLLTTSNLNASNINTGTVGNAYLDTDLQDLADGTLSKSKVQDSGNWDTAYGWGDHSTAGYVDGTSLDASNISTGTVGNSYLDTDLQDLADGTLSKSKVEDYGNWDTAYGWGDHSTAGYIDGTSLNAANITTGSLADARMPTAFLKDGSRSMSGSINLGINSITNIMTLYSYWGSYVDFAEEGALRCNLSVKPISDNTKSLGHAGLRWSDIYAVTEHIGDIREFYTFNPGYTYSVGDVVAMDTTAEYDIKPSAGLRSRLLGVVAEDADVVNGTVDVAIYGKFSPVKVKGTIQAGDYLVGSGTTGVATSMYNCAHPLLQNALPASTNPDVYNSIAKTLPTVGIATENYNSPEVGTIGLMLGK